MPPQRLLFYGDKGDDDGARLGFQKLNAFSETANVYHSTFAAPRGKSGLYSTLQ